MPSPVYTDADFVAGFQRLLPTGPIWPRDPESVLAQTILPLVKGYTRNAASALGLLADALPVTPVMLLPEWQQTLGLPDPCAGPAATLEISQQQVNARFIASGGQSAAYYIGVAAALGYPITITQFAPFRAGQGRAGQPLYGKDWAFAWQVNAPTFAPEYFRAGSGTAGQPLVVWGNTVLQCELQRLAPAQTILLFNYS
jgi:uncharacterized protein YmfQ (DUF2313 family)